VSDEVRQRLIELATIDRWNQRFAREEQNAESYLARERRRWELLFELGRRGIKPERKVLRQST
jgi:hypothetical protein